MLKNIMCFGDSNTHGFIAGSGNRYDEYTRWTRLLQKKLGADYYVIEEGMNGRTTVFDDPDMKSVNGSSILEACLSSHKPLDLVIIMLGTNDTKERFCASVKDIALGLEKLVQMTRSFEPKVKKLLIVSPIHISDSITKSNYCDSFGGMKGAEKSRRLAAEYQRVAEEYQCHFLDAADVCVADDTDAIHLDVKGHAALADAMYSMIKEIENTIL